MGYVTIKTIGHGYDVNSVNPLYLRIDKPNGYIEEINEDKYLVFGAKDENKKLLKRYDDAFNGIMSKVTEIDGDWLEYAKECTKIRVSLQSNLPLNKPLKFYNVTVTIRCVFSEDNELYPRLFLDGALFRL